MNKRKSWNPHWDGHAHQHPALTSRLISKHVPKVKISPLCDRNWSFSPSLIPASPPHQYQPHQAIKAGKTHSCIARKAVILIGPGTMETEHQQVRAAWGCTYRSFNETVLPSFSWTYSSFAPRSLPRQHTSATCHQPGLLAPWHTQSQGTHSHTTQHESDFGEAGLLPTPQHLSTGPQLMAIYCCYAGPRCPWFGSFTQPTQAGPGGKRKPE